MFRGSPRLSIRGHLGFVEEWYCLPVDPRDQGSTAVEIVHHRPGQAPIARQDAVATEEPLALRVDGAEWTVVMRTPGHDLELAVGLLWAEGVITDPADIASVLRCEDAPEDQAIDVRRSAAAQARPPPARTLLSSTSCGVCGKRAIEDLSIRTPPFPAGRSPDPLLLAGLPERLRQGQSIFDQTGGLHAAGVFRGSGELLVLREDVGRHNAVDKCVGHLVLNEGARADTILVVSGRVSFEIVQKAWVAGIQTVVAVSAPSSLAVSLARASGIALFGFARGDAINAYR